MLGNVLAPVYNYLCHDGFLCIRRAVVTLNGQEFLSKTWRSVSWQILTYIVIHLSKDTLRVVNYANKGCFFHSRSDLFVFAKSFFNGFFSSK